MSKIVIATNNKGKLAEITAILQDLRIELVSPAQIGVMLDVAETGETYAENAKLKGMAFWQAAGLPTLADDSGLEVDALGGRPGLYSARFSPLPEATDADRRAYLLEQLQGHSRPWTARFRCIVALVSAAGEVRLTEGICPGEIIPEERGEHGFGYDPIFYLPESGKTMAELDMDVKNRLSHRGRAVQAARPIIIEWLTKKS